VAMHQLDTDITGHHVQWRNGRRSPT